MKLSHNLICLKNGFVIDNNYFVFVYLRNKSDIQCNRKMLFIMQATVF